MAAPRNNLAQQIRGLLDRLVMARRLDNDEQEVIGDEVAAQARGLPRDGVMEALDKAIGSNKQRRREAVYLLSELADVAKCSKSRTNEVAISLQRGSRFELLKRSVTSMDGHLSGTNPMSQRQPNC